MDAEERARSDIGDDERARATLIEAPGDRSTDPSADGRAARGHERCIHHPARSSAARCDRCGEPVCLACAVPVRGHVLGPECLAAALGDPALTSAAEPDEPSVGSWMAVAGALVALLGTAAPWTRTGAGDRVLGAWVPNVRWSMVAATATAVLVPLAWWLRARGPEAWGRMVTLLATGVVVTSVLAIAFPPTFQAASWGPWVAAAGGGIAASGRVAQAVLERRRTQGG